MHNIFSFYRKLQTNAQTPRKYDRFRSGIMVNSASLISSTALSTQREQTGKTIEPKRKEHPSFSSLYERVQS